MTTTGERLVTLSGLPGVETAMTHYLAITTGGGSGGTVVMDIRDLILEPEEVITLDAEDDLLLGADGDLIMTGDGDLILDADEDLEATDE